VTELEQAPLTNLFNIVEGASDSFYTLISGKRRLHCLTENIIGAVIYSLFTHQSNKSFALYCLSPSLPSGRFSTFKPT
jgi:hypothetical protein